MDIGNITVLRGPDRVRKRPAVIFSSDGIDGVACAVRSLLEIFAVEAQLGYCRQLCVQQNGAELIISGDDRGIYLGRESSEDWVWKSLFCDIHAASAYAPDESGLYFGLQDIAHHMLYSDPTGQTPDWLPDEIGMFELCAIQYASEYMEVQVCRDGQKTVLHFEKGYPTGEARREKATDGHGTSFRFRPDGEVFKETILPASFFCKTLNAFAVLSPGLRCRYINDETGEEAVFCCPRGLQDYAEQGDAIIPAYVSKQKAVGKERYNRAAYEACVEVAVGYAPYKGSVTCLHNFRELPQGGTHCEQLKKQVVRAFCDAFRRDMADTEDVTFEWLAKHLRIVLATWCAPRCTVWGSGARTSIENKMIADMTYDAAGSELCNYVFTHRKVFGELLQLLRETP